MLGIQYQGGPMKFSTGSSAAQAAAWRCPTSAFGGCLCETGACGSLTDYTVPALAAATDRK